MLDLCVKPRKEKKIPTIPHCDNVTLEKKDLEKWTIRSPSPHHTFVLNRCNDPVLSTLLESRTGSELHNSTAVTGWDTEAQEDSNKWWRGQLVL